MKRDLERLADETFDLLIIGGGVNGLATARDALPGWSRLPAGTRADWLRKLAAALTRERDRFAAWQVLEAGKNWAEADADVVDDVGPLPACTGRDQGRAIHKVLKEDIDARDAQALVAGPFPPLAYIVKDLA